MIIKKEGRFEAAHMLSNYTGKCSNLHGHSYWYEITLVGGINEATGMVMDYNGIKEVVDRLDHAVIFAGDGARGKAEQELMDWCEKYGMRYVTMPDDQKPTAENLAEYIGRKFKAQSVAVRLKETDSSEAVYESA